MVRFLLFWAVACIFIERSNASSDVFAGSYVAVRNEACVDSSGSSLDSALYDATGSRRECFQLCDNVTQCVALLTSGVSNQDSTCTLNFFDGTIPQNLPKLYGVEPDIYNSSTAESLSSDYSYAYTQELESNLVCYMKLTNAPTSSQTASPTQGPTQGPTTPPLTMEPTQTPTKEPTQYPTAGPTQQPTTHPTTIIITSSPTTEPTPPPTLHPTTAVISTSSPTLSPTTDLKTSAPSKAPTRTPTIAPTTASPTGPTTASPTTASPTAASSLVQISSASRSSRRIDYTSALLALALALAYFI